jgi:hypothetical protein
MPTLKKIISLAVLLAGAPLFASAQDIGTAADTPPFYLQVSYDHVSRDFTLAGAKEEIVRGIYKAAAGFAIGPNVGLYGFAGSSDFPNTRVGGGRALWIGGGLKYRMLGEVEIIESDGKTLDIKGGIGLDFQVARLQNAEAASYDDLSLTRYQGSIDFGLRILRFAGYLGFKFSSIRGRLTPAGSIEELEVEGRGLFSMVMGFNWYLRRHLALVSEFSFFSESFWGLGLRWNI